MNSAASCTFFQIRFACRNTRIGMRFSRVFSGFGGQLYDELCAFSRSAIHRYLSFVDGDNP